MTVAIGSVMASVLIRDDARQYLPNSYRDTSLAWDWYSGGPFANAYWPKSGFAGDVNGDSSLLDPYLSRAEPWETPPFGAGGSTRYAVNGVSRDQYGSAVAGVTVNLFSTAGNLLLDSTVSSATGAFSLLTPLYPDTHYVTAYKAGAPDISGASVNTLIGI